MRAEKIKGKTLKERAAMPAPLLTLPGFPPPMPHSQDANKDFTPYDVVNLLPPSDQS